MTGWSRESSHVEVNDATTRVLIYRRGEADMPAERPIVMIHGLNGGAENWASLVGRLTTGDLVLAPDLRGHGQSDWRRDGYWMRSFADDVISLVDQWQLDRFDLIGHSLGARICMIVAGELGDRVRTLALSDCAPEISRVAASDVRDRAGSLAEKRGYRSREEVWEFMRATYPAWRAEFIDENTDALFRKNWAGRWVRRADPDLSWITGAAGLAEVDLMWDMCKRTVAPTLVMRGARSEILDADLAGRMVQAMAEAHLVEFDAGHYLPFEVPDAFMSTYCEFLAAH